jgi:hypothetical protein
MRLAVLAAAILAAAGLGSAYAAGAFGGDSQPHPAATGVAPPSPDATELGVIRELTLKAASNFGDPTPTDGVLVATTRRLAELVDVDTNEPDTPVYFVLVHGRFTDYAARIPKGAKPPTGTLLTLTIDPATNKSLDSGLVRNMPDLNAIGTPQPLPLADGSSSLGTDLALTRTIACPDRHAHLVGPRVVRRFHAVTAVSCIDGTHTYPGQGQWAVQIRRVEVGKVAAIQRYFEQPSRRKLPKGGGCLDVAHFTLLPVLVDGERNRLVPRTPVDRCGDRLGNAYGLKALSTGWHVVSVRKVRLMVSAAALAAHCAMGIKDLPAGGIGPLDRTSGGPLFRSTPKTVRICIYRTRDFEVGNFVRGFALGAAPTHRLLGAMTRAAPSGSCPSARTFAVIHANPELWAEVELGGCWRVGRAYPDYGLGGADASVVSTILARR